MDLNAKKLAKFDPMMLYSDVPTSAIHSLEAFVGKVDFQKVAHHKRSGSMMGSPAATAAYLVFSGTSDEDMIAYLQGVSHHWQAPEIDAFPSVFPSTIFELTWVWLQKCPTWASIDVNLGNVDFIRGRFHSIISWFRERRSYLRLH